MTVWTAFGIRHWFRLAWVETGWSGMGWGGMAWHGHGNMGRRRGRSSFSDTCNGRGQMRKQKGMDVGRSPFLGHWMTGA